jgi:hypothetical protein
MINITKLNIVESMPLLPEKISILFLILKRILRYLIIYKHMIEILKLYIIQNYKVKT